MLDVFFFSRIYSLTLFLRNLNFMLCKSQIWQKVFIIIRRHFTENDERYSNLINFTWSSKFGFTMKLWLACFLKISKGYLTNEFTIGSKTGPLYFGIRLLLRDYKSRYIFSLIRVLSLIQNSQEFGSDHASECLAWAWLWYCIWPKHHKDPNPTIHINVYQQEGSGSSLDLDLDHFRYELDLDSDPALIIV